MGSIKASKRILQVLNHRGDFVVDASCSIFLVIEPLAIMGVLASAD